MKRYFHESAWVALCVVALVPACGGISESTDASAGRGGSGASAGTSAGGTHASTGGASNGSGATGSAGTPSRSTGGTSHSQIGGSCAADGNTMLIPNANGWVDGQDICNDVGVQGAWFAYGDQYANGNRINTCLVYGNHAPSECAQITTPDPSIMAFPNVNGFMQTTGTVEKVLPCVAGSMASIIPTSGCPGGGMPGGFDFSSMWGAGIGFDFNAHVGAPNGDGKRDTWDPSAYGIIGIEFTIQRAPQALRVEFPMLLTAAEAAADTPPVTTEPPTTDEYSIGAPYWGARPDETFGSSPVVEGVNVITWDQVDCPRAGAYVFDTKRLLGIRFHVPTNSGSSSPYDFTIWNFTFLRQL